MRSLPRFCYAKVLRSRHFPPGFIVVLSTHYRLTILTHFLTQFCYALSCLVLSPPCDLPSILALMLALRLMLAFCFLSRAWALVAQRVSRYPKATKYAIVLYSACSWLSSTVGHVPCGGAMGHCAGDTSGCIRISTSTQLWCTKNALSCVHNTPYDIMTDTSPHPGDMCYRILHARHRGHRRANRAAFRRPAPLAIRRRACRPRPTRLVVFSEGGEAIKLNIEASLTIPKPSI